MISLPYFTLHRKYRHMCTELKWMGMQQRFQYNIYIYISLKANIWMHVSDTLVFSYWMNISLNWIQPISTFWINFWIEFCRNIYKWRRINCLIDALDWGSSLLSSKMLPIILKIYSSPDSPKTLRGGRAHPWPPSPCLVN